MKKLMLAMTLVAAFVTSHATGMPKKPEGTTDHRWLTEHPTIQKMHSLINEERENHGLEPLELDPHMCLKAQEHAVWMAETGWYQHSNYPWPEIIHHGPQSAEDAVNGWIWSPAHHGIMLGGGKQCGYGYMVIDGRCYWIGVFQ